MSPAVPAARDPAPDAASGPVPPWTHDVPVPEDASVDVEFRRLPAAAGICAIEDASGGTLAMAAGADLRRLVRSRLAAPAAGGHRRAALRPLARRVLAQTVGSRFEADWAFLGHARRRLPLVCEAWRDRNPAWFVACEPGAAHPRLARTGRPAAAEGTVHLGPIADKHAAGRYIELLQEAFDLCRYHHILVQAPHGQACAYKEMGRCPAPCDGTVTMDAYRAQVTAAIAFAATPIDEVRRDVEQRMQQASARLDFEQAERHRLLLERIEPARKRAFAHVDRLERFRYAALLPSERASAVRVFLILGGLIEPQADLMIDRDDPAAARRAADEIAGMLTAARTRPAVLAPEAIDHIALVAGHLYRPATRQRGACFLKLSEELDPKTVVAAIGKVLRGGAAAPAADDDFEEVFEEAVR